MNVDERRAAPFDEQAALAELEGVLRELEASRQRRRTANDAFDRFLKSFSRPTPAPAASAPPGRGGSARVPAIEPADDARRPAQGPAIEAADHATRPLPGLPARASAAVASSPSSSAGTGLQEQMAGERREPEGTPAGAPPRRRRLPGGVPLGLAAVALGAFVVFGVFGGGRARDPREAPSRGAAGERASTPAPVTPSPAEAPPAARSPAGRTDAPASAVTGLTTLRPVWVRVTVDGERVLERELPAGEHVPLSPRETIVVRAGDGGAVRLALEGKDQGVLGEDGRAVTRRYDVTALK